MSGESRKLKSIRNDIAKHFGFMFGRGFAVASAEYSSKHFGFWTVELASPICSVHVDNDRGFIGLEFLPAGESNNSRRLTLEQILRAAGRGEEVIEPLRRSFLFDEKRQLERHARLLEKYLDVVLGHYFRRTA